MEKIFGKGRVGMINREEKKGGKWIMNRIVGDERKKKMNMEGIEWRSKRDEEGEKKGKIEVLKVEIRSIDKIEGRK